MTIKILIGADICPTKTNFNLFSKADLKSLIGEDLIDLLHSADYTIFNLEVPLSDKMTPIAKNGINLIAPTSTISGLKAINPYFFTLANNHILDQGIEGLNSTISLLKQAGLSFSGIGQNLDEANKPYIANIKGLKIGIYCCAEHEFSIATETTPGANPYDPLISFDTVRELRKQCDFVIVLYHGGKEHYRYPYPQLQRVFRKFADCGSGLVVAQHSHCIGCYENYKGATLVYGQGNFLFDELRNEFRSTSLLIEVSFELKKQDKVKFIPCVRFEKGVRLANTMQSKEILNGFYERTEKIKDSKFLQKTFLEHVKTQYNIFLSRCFGKLANTLLFRIINKLSGYRFFLWLYNEKNLLLLRNSIECETLYEILKYTFRNCKKGRK